ncbi:MAG: hypothetical protein ABIH83_01090 [Candidatus Micrarchaeota archaeon]
MYDKDGDLQFEQTEPFEMVFPPPPSITTSYSFTCTPEICKNKITVEVIAIGNGLASESAFITIDLDDGAPRYLMPPLIRIEPDDPEWGEDFIIYTTQPDESLPALEHKYKIYEIDGEEQEEILSFTLPVQNRETQYNFECGSEYCDNPILVTVKAADGSDESEAGNLLIQFRPVALPPPVLVSATPQDVFEQLDWDGIALIFSESDVIINIEAGGGGQTPDKFVYEGTINGEEMGIISGTKPASELQQMRINCNDIGCKYGDYIRLDITAYEGVRQSRPLSLNFYVSDPEQGLMPAIGRICSKKEINSLIVYSVAGFVAMIFIIAITFMLGNALHQPRFLDWSKMEAMQIVFSFVLFALIFIALQLQCNLNIVEFKNWLGGQGGLALRGTTMMEAAQDYVEWSVGQTHLTLVMLRRDLGAINMRATYSNYDNQGLGLGMNGFSYAPYSGDYTTTGAMGMLMNLNTGFMLTNLFEYFSLAFFASSTGFLIFLVPIGFLLRSVPFLRGLGGGLVAIGVGFYIMYPIIFAMLAIALPPAITNDASKVFDDRYCGGKDCGTGNNLQLKIDKVQADEESITGKNIFSYFDDHPNPKINTNPNDEEFPRVDLATFFRLTAINFIRTFFLPTVGLVITISIIRDMSGLLGDEVDATKLVQMV